MPVAKLQKVPRTGNGVLIVARQDSAVAFSLLLTSGPAGRKGGKGSVTGEPEVLRQASAA